MKREMIGKEITDNLRMKQRDNKEKTGCNRRKWSCRSLIGLSTSRARGKEVWKPVCWVLREWRGGLQGLVCHAAAAITASSCGQR
ncbi:hypothetical protein IQ07DRAFT_111178 [Pyrenochaeta sp. DS3sAY3a]|nr:hypothetical protein IQ07DRAFT_111178 [Pyrenochaeta sp. DS3sAY3a]